MLGKAFDVDGCRGDDDLKIMATLNQLAQIAQQKVDVKTALVRFINDEGVIAQQLRIMLNFGQQDTVGHQLDSRMLIGIVGKTHLKTDRFTQRHLQLFGQTRGHITRCETPRLGMTDQPTTTAARFQTQLGNLSCFPRTGFPRDHDDLMRFQQFQYFIVARRHGQFRRILQSDGPRQPRLQLLKAGIALRLQRCQRAVDRLTLFDAPPQCRKALAHIGRFT